ncbi:MAG: hypothetical protein RMJ36_03885 [Candidatus Calescibacterium sp.]|nr:hypothetical protein [Candidatus Calescibacterium sp.]MDW8132777.1 hypothetical protein [Candidatus Calescibacterium sp.]
MKAIVEIKHNKNLEVIYFRSGFLRISKYASISEAQIDEIKNREIILIVPDSLLITKSLSISFDIKNILAIKSYLMKSIPVNLSELYNDYFIFGNKLYFVSIKKEVLNDYFNVMRKVKAKLKAVIPKSFLFKIVFNLNYPKFFGFNFDDHYTSIFSFEGNGYYFFMVLPYGSEGFVGVDDEIQITKFINEVYRMVSSFQSQTKINIEEFFFFTNKEYGKLPVLSYLSKTFPGMNFFTMDDGKYLDLYSKILDFDKKFPIDLSVDKISSESKRELVLSQIDNSLGFVIIGMILILVLSIVMGNDSLRKHKMILEGIKNNYQSQRNLFIYNQPSVDQSNRFYFYQIFNSLNVSNISEIYLESFYIKDDKFYLIVVSPRYSQISLLVNELKTRDIVANIEGNSKFKIFDNYELNRAQIRIETNK